MSTPSDAKINSKTFNFLKRCLRLPADALIGSSKNFIRKKFKQLFRESLFRESAAFDLYEPDQESFILLAPNDQKVSRDNLGLPVPPQELWQGYGLNMESFLRSGKTNIDTMSEILHSSGFQIQNGNRILDFGCASGRMIRYLYDIAARCEIWGVDISARHIIWCREHLTPPFHFATITTAPHLPFEDGHFDLIYCGSVFTHISDLAEAWLLELKRILKPGGVLYITIHDKHTIDLVLNHPEKVYPDGLRVNDELRNALLSFDKTWKFTSSDFYMFSIGRGANSQVFYDLHCVSKHWRQILDVLSVHPEAYGKQTAMVMRKPVPTTNEKTSNETVGLDKTSGAPATTT